MAKLNVCLALGPSVEIQSLNGPVSFLQGVESENEGVERQEDREEAGDDKGTIGARASERKLNDILTASVVRKERKEMSDRTIRGIRLGGESVR